MKTAQKVLVLAGVTIGMIAGTGTGTALAASPVTSIAATAVAAPMDRHDDNDGNKDRDGGRDNKNWKGGGHDWKGGNNWKGGHDRWRGDHDWNHKRGDNHRWRWEWRDNRHHSNWDSYTVSPRKCRNGGGHVENHRCDGGRYDNRWVRF